jgi:hypothetical protein
VIDLRSEVLSGGKAMWFRRRRKRSGRGRRWNLTLHIWCSVDIPMGKIL